MSKFNSSGRFSRWNLQSRLDHFASLESHVEDVLEQLQPAQKDVVELLRNIHGEMQLVGHFFSSYPGIHFEASTISKLAALNLGVDFDFYYMYSDRREDS